MPSEVKSPERFRYIEKAEEEEEEEEEEGREEEEYGDVSQSVSELVSHSVSE